MIQTTQEKFKLRYAEDTHVMDIDSMAVRSLYFDSLLSRWNNSLEDNKTFELPLFDFASSQAVWSVLWALEIGRLTPETQDRLKLPDEESFSLGLEMVELAFFFSAESFFLPIYCSGSQPKHRVKVAMALCGNYTNQLESLLSTRHFFQGFDRESVPLNSELCVSLTVVNLLLKAYSDAPPKGYISSFYSLFKPRDKHIPKPLTSNQFAMLALVRFCSSSHWEHNGLDMILDFLPTGNQGSSSAVSLPKPEHIEDVVCYVIQRDLPIPEVFKASWSMNPSEVVPALVAGGRLRDLAVFENRTDMLRYLVGSWSTEECLANLQNDHGGFRGLFEFQEDDECSWMAQIPELADIYRRTATRRGDVSQQLVFRRLFLHLDFDPTIQASLLETLPLWKKEVTQKAILHGVQHLEHGNFETLDLPWEKAPARLVERAARALRENETHAIWRRLDLDKLSGDFLYYVPAGLLAVHALEGARHTHERLRHAYQRIERLERDLDILRIKVNSGD